MLEYRNEDWADYRTAAGLTLRTGVVARWFGHVLVKELVDNALDAAVTATVTFGLLHRSPGRVVIYVADDGGGIPGTDEEIASRYSIRREMVSSKRHRRPSRGALGNGLRVVMGVMCVGEGVLRISTRGRTLRCGRGPTTAGLRSSTLPRGQGPARGSKSS